MEITKELFKDTLNDLINDEISSTETFSKEIQEQIALTYKKMWEQKLEFLNSEIGKNYYMDDYGQIHKKEEQS